MLNVSKLEKAMMELGFTKVKLCSTTGIARTTLDAILNGADAKISTIESLASALHLQIGFLFDEDIEVRTAGRDYVESGNIEHHGTEYNGTSSIEHDLRAQIAQLKSQLEDKERIIKLLEEK